MANTYTQIHIQIVFAVKYRQSLIGDKWKDQLYKYIVGVIGNNGHKVLQINGMQDHIHILIGMRTNQSLSDLVKQIKQNSSKWINEKRFVQGKFSWQGGYAAFSYSNSDVQNVIRYIQDQEVHHNSISFNNEFLELLNEFEIEFNPEYLFQPIL